MLDFDWSGERKQQQQQMEEETHLHHPRYPPFMNVTGGIKWPEGAHPNQPILQEHDLAAIDMILKDLQEGRMETEERKNDLERKGKQEEAEGERMNVEQEEEEESA